MKKNVATEVTVDSSSSLRRRGKMGVAEGVAKEGKGAGPMMGKSSVTLVWACLLLVLSEVRVLLFPNYTEYNTSVQTSDGFRLRIFPCSN